MRNLTIGRIATYLLVPVIVMLAGCKDSIRTVGEYKCADLVKAKTYYGRPAPERMAEIRSFPLEKRYAVFICGIGYIRPPSWDGAQSFIENGSSIISFLESKLQSARHDLEISGTIALIDEIDYLGSYAAWKDDDLMHILDSSMRRIRDPLLKQEAEARLQRMSEAGNPQKNE